MSAGGRPDDGSDAAANRTAGARAPYRNDDLRSAVDDVVRRYSQDPVNGVTPEQVRRAAESIANAIENGTEPVVNATDAALQRRLLDSLRGALIDVWSHSSPDSAAILELLSSLERIAAAIERRLPISSSAPSGVEFVGRTLAA